MEDLTILKDVEFLVDEVESISRQLMDLHDRCSSKAKSNDWFCLELQTIIGTTPMFTCEWCFRPCYTIWHNGLCAHCNTTNTLF